MITFHPRGATRPPTDDILSRLCLEPFMPPDAPAETSERIAIVELLDRKVVAWDRGDAEAYSANVRSDCVMTNIAGMVFTGHRAFEQQHAHIFSTFFRGSRMTQSLRSLRFLRPDVAIADLEVQIAGYRALPPGVKASADGVLLTRLEQVFVKDGAMWSIASYHNVDVKPEQRSP